MSGPIPPTMHYPDHFARFLPAISNMYADELESTTRRRVPVSLTDLDFLNPASGLFHIDAALFRLGENGSCNCGRLLAEQQYSHNSQGHQDNQYLPS